MDDAFLAPDVFFRFVHVHLTGFGRHRGRKLVHEARQAAHLFHLLDLAQEIVQVKASAAFDFGRQFLGGFHVDTRRHLLHQGHDVAHAQNASGMAVGIKHFQPVYFFAGTCELDGRARHLPHRQRSTAARIAIGFGQDDAGQRQRFLKGLGRVDGVLTLHGIHHKQGFNRVQGGMQILDLAHQQLVDRQAAGGID